MRAPPAIVLCVLTAALTACTEQDLENITTSHLAIIQVQNLRFQRLEKVYTPPCTGGALGPDRLADRGGSVASGGLRTFSLAPGCYDVVGDFDDGSRRTVEDIRTFADVQSRVVFPQ